MNIVTVNAREESPARLNCYLIWGDGDGNLYTTDELDADYRAEVHPEILDEDGMMSEVNAIAAVETCRIELGLLSQPDANGGECIFF